MYFVLYKRALEQGRAWPLSPLELPLTLSVQLQSNSIMCTVAVDWTYNRVWASVGLVLTLLLAVETFPQVSSQAPSSVLLLICITSLCAYQSVGKPWKKRIWSIYPCRQYKSELLMRPLFPQINHAVTDQLHRQYAIWLLMVICQPHFIRVKLSSYTTPWSALETQYNVQFHHGRCMWK